MAMEIGHVHIKTYDPKKTAQFYIDNFGATMKSEAANGNIHLDLHGVQLNVTTIVAAQKRKQMMGIEHIALQTDDYPGAIARLKSNGAHIMLEQVGSNGRHVAFIEAPDGAQMELIEKKYRLRALPRGTPLLVYWRETLMTRAYNVVDADGHILEPLDLWDKYMEPRFRDRAPRIVKEADGRERLVIEEQTLGSKERGIGAIGAVGARQ